MGTLTNSEGLDEWKIVRYFTRVCTVCNDENNIKGKKYIFLQDSSILSFPLEYKGFIK